MEEQLVTRLDENHLLVKFQSAYHAGFSTETALLQAMNDLLWSMNVVKWFSGSFFNILYLSFFFFAVLFFAQRHYCCTIHPGILTFGHNHSTLWPLPMRSTGDVRWLVGCHPKETLHCCRVTSMVFTSACSDSTYTGHHLLCPY